MRILALESSAKAASVALLEDGRFAGQYWQCTGLTHSRTLMAMAESMLKNMELKVSDIDVFAVAKGPGSFTGIRIGVAAAKGLAWGADKPLCGVSTLEAMAWQLSEREDVIICPVMDARRNQVYNALFAWQNGKPERLCEDRAISVEELIAQAAEHDRPFMFVGDGAELCAAAFTDAGIAFRFAPEPLRQQSAWGVAMAASLAEPGPADDLVPDYLRLPQAERERLARLNNK